MKASSILKFSSLFGSSFRIQFFINKRKKQRITCLTSLSKRNAEKGLGEITNERNLLCATMDRRLRRVMIANVLKGDDTRRNLLHIRYDEENEFPAYTLCLMPGRLNNEYINHH